MTETHDKRTETHACDLIGRQAAIDKFEPWLKVDGYSEGELNMLKAVLYELRVMPPAQPEQRWIPCKERLPEKDGEYLTTTEDGLYDVEYYSDGEWYDDDVVAWMPFPEWKGEQE